MVEQADHAVSESRRSKSTGRDQRTIKVLAIEDQPGDLRLIHTYLTENPLGRFILNDAGDLASGIELAKMQTFDVVLLDLTLPDSSGVDTVTRFCTEVSRIPVVVLTGVDQREIGLRAVRAGAQDYLLKSKIDQELLGRAILYAMERSVLANGLQDTLIAAGEPPEHELARLETLAVPPSTVRTAESYGEVALRKVAPDVFEFLVNDYRGLVSSSLRAHSYKGETGLDFRVRSLAQRLGSLRALPRDVIDVHVTVLKLFAKDGNRARMHSLTEEGRVLLLQIMGHLALYYRTFMGPAPYQGPSSKSKEG